MNVHHDPLRLVFVSTCSGWPLQAFFTSLVLDVGSSLLPSTSHKKYPTNSRRQSYHFFISLGFPASSVFQIFLKNTFYFQNILSCFIFQQSYCFGLAKRLEKDCNRAEFSWIFFGLSSWTQFKIFEFELRLFLILYSSLTL